MCDYHQFCANGIVDMFEKFYYKRLERKRELSIQKMLSQSNLKDNFVFKPEYFNYLLFYQIYLISHHWSHQNHSGRKQDADLELQRVRGSKDEHRRTVALSAPNLAQRPDQQP
jgi:hypothetical protein